MEADYLHFSFAILSQFESYFKLKNDTPAVYIKMNN